MKYKKLWNESKAFRLGEKIRTSGLLNPIQARYQTAPHPDIIAFQRTAKLYYEQVDMSRSFYHCLSGQMITVSVNYMNRMNGSIQAGLCQSSVKGLPEGIVTEMISGFLSMSQSLYSAVLSLP